MDSTNWDSDEDGRLTCPVSSCQQSIDPKKFKKHYCAKHPDISDHIPREVIEQLKRWRSGRAEDKSRLERGQQHDLSAAFDGYSTTIGDDLSVQNFEQMQEERIEIFPNAGN